MTIFPIKMTSTERYETDPTHWSERDKSRPYAVRQITTLSRIMENAKPKEIFLVILTI